MPQELRVGHRSSLVSLVGLGLVMLGLSWALRRLNAGRVRQKFA
jgi:hypothetical protein